MTKGNSILLAAVAGAVLAALIANYLSTERGRQFLNSATDTLKDLSGKATEYAKNNLGEIVRETTNSLGPVVKEKIAQQVQKSTQSTNPE
jgi:gas vesicle protein